MHLIQHCLCIAPARRTRLSSTYRAAVLVCALAVTLCAAAARADMPQNGPGAEADPARLGRSTAVALNYCRASFHRIERYPSKRVLVEEREKILNNLNLNQIADEEVVRLYTAVLDEINRIQIADGDRLVLRDVHRRAVTQHLFITAFQLSTQLACAEYAPAVRTGIKSWWDYRGMVLTRELEQWKIEKARMTDIVDKSSLFLDTFWKLARRRSIPDNWLVRSSDLERLDEALREQDLEIRLRVLKRMQGFMECYPPYWYYLARTQQGLGQLFAAAETYEKLVALGDGHFRKDEMLAAGLANLAVIREYLQQRDAGNVAGTALTYSPDAWEVNLMCARVLERHGKINEAEDAILRNLDVDLEREQSFVCLVSLYYHAAKVDKLTQRLGERSDVRLVPPDALLRCAALLGPERTPPAVIEAIKNSLYGSVEARFGPDDFAFYASQNWSLNAADISLNYNETPYAGQPVLTQSRGNCVIRFSSVADVGNPISAGAQPGPVFLNLQFVDAPPVQLALEYAPASAQELQAADGDRSGLLTGVLPMRRTVYRIMAAKVGEQVVIVEPGKEFAFPAAPASPEVIVNDAPSSSESDASDDDPVEIESSPTVPAAPAVRTSPEPAGPVPAPIVPPVNSSASPAGPSLGAPPQTSPAPEKP